MAKHLCEIHGIHAGVPLVYESQIVESDKLAIEIEREVNQAIAENTHSEKGPETMVQCSTIDLIGHTTFKAFKDRAVDLERDLTIMIK